ncbi:unnamed protein product [Hymenolepis diminuta]|uniref:DUF5727 domain-containing protein n=1 Tax=Hymenolepis diminuta TaxID=6216 RepID=A0A564ZEL9_HYMDI|nr:unnamed protein product [Hymenolepis diminuta]
MLSRVITNSSGRVGPMLFQSPSPMNLSMQKTPGSNFVPLKLVNGSCVVGDSIVGSPCDAEGYHTLITLDEFPDYHLLRLKGDFRHYTVFFAEDCKFPTPKNGEIIVKKSIPLYRYLGGKREENVIFAMKGTNFDNVICNFCIEKIFMYTTCKFHHT